MLDQVDSLLSSVTPPFAQYGAEVDSLVARLKDILSKLPPKAPVPLSESRRLLKRNGIELPLKDPADEVQWKAGFAPPADLWIAGSWKTRCGIKGERGRRRNGLVDVMVEVPAVRHVKALASGATDSRAELVPGQGLSRFPILSQTSPLPRTPCCRPVIVFGLVVV